MGVCKCAAASGQLTAWKGRNEALLTTGSLSYPTAEQCLRAYSLLQARADADINIRKAGLQESLAHLDAMSAAIVAARAYGEADCCKAAVSAAQTAIQLGQQLQGTRR